MQTSKFNIGDRVSFKNENGKVVKCTVKDIGVFGNKLSSKRVYVYDLCPDDCDFIIHSILEHALTKI
jgi:hypothetical protein